MALNASNSSNLEQLALKGLIIADSDRLLHQLKTQSDCEDHCCKENKSSAKTAVSLIHKC